jgi:uncharacterized protein RhaS with RHS repeats
MIPSFGRETSPDPIGFSGGDGNLYAYVGNDPVNLIDSSGLSWSEGIRNGVTGLFVGLAVGAGVAATAPAWLAAGIAVGAAGVGGFMLGVDVTEYVGGRDYWSGEQLTWDERTTRGGQALVGTAALAAGCSRWMRRGAEADAEWLRMSPKQRLRDDWGKLTTSKEVYDSQSHLPASERQISLRDIDVTQYGNTFGTGATPLGRFAWMFGLAGAEAAPR